MTRTCRSRPPAFRTKLRLSQDSLRTLSEETGGFAVVNQNDFRHAFERIVKDNSSYYVLGYYPTNDKRDGKFRKIQVRVTRPGVQVQARDGYTAPKGRAAATKTKSDVQVPPDVADALGSPIPSTGVGLSMFAAPFSGAGSKSSLAVVVEFNPAKLNFIEADGKFNDDLELHILALDAAGKLQDGGA